MKHPFSHSWHGEEGAASCVILVLAFLHQRLSSSCAHRVTVSSSVVAAGCDLRPPSYHRVHRLVTPAVTEQLRRLCAIAVWCDYSTDLFPVAAAGRNPYFSDLRNNMRTFLKWAISGSTVSDGLHTNAFEKKSSGKTASLCRDVVCEMKAQSAGG